MAKRLSNEIRVYTEDDLLKLCNDKIKSLYSDLKSAVLSLGKDITIHPTKTHIAFHRKQRSQDSIHLNLGSGLISESRSELKDPKRIAKGLSHEPSEIPYALSLLKQAYHRS